MEINIPNLNKNYIFPSANYHPLTLISAGETSFHPKPRKKRSPKLTKTTGPKPTRKPDPYAPKITRPCTECGKKFWSWKALFGHMRCHPERNWRGINPPPDVRRSDSDSGDYFSAVTEEDHEAATCLLLLANGPTRGSDQSLSLTTVNQVPEYSNSDPSYQTNNNNGFECSSCKKVFGSHHALGGHRASHKNVKGCFAINRNCEDEEEKEEEGGEEGHKCSICWRIFSSGQALGGHMRCHWEPLTSNSALISPIRVSGNTNATGFDLNIPIHNHNCDGGYSSAGLALDLRLGL